MNADEVKIVVFLSQHFGKAVSHRRFKAPTPPLIFFHSFSNPIYQLVEKNADSTVQIGKMISSTVL